VNQLINIAHTADTINSYTEIRKAFVRHLSENGMDWKVGKSIRRTELFHKAILVLENANPVQKINTSQLFSIGEYLYSKRQLAESVDVEVGTHIKQLTDSYSDFPIERYELKQLLKTLDTSIANLLTDTFVKQLKTGHSELVSGALQKLLSAKGVTGVEAQTLKYTTNPITVTGHDDEKALKDMGNGFTGLRKQTLKQHLERLEEIRLDQKKIEQINSNDSTQNQEIYWHYRKQMALHSELDLEKVLEVAPKVWSIFIRNKNKKNVTLPLQYPINEYLRTITCYLLNKSEANTTVEDQLDYTPVIPNEALQNWDNTIKKEESILDNIKRNDQRFFGQLVNDYQSEFAAGLRKVFKLYDNALKERPREIYYRSLSEVIHKVETGKLAKPLTSTFKTFLIGVGVNHYRQEYYKKTEKPLDLDDGVVENIVEPDTIERKHQQEANAAKVKEYLGKIGEPCGELLEMKFLKGFNYEVMAIKAGKKEGALRTQVSRCLDRLRKMIFGTS